MYVTVPTPAHTHFLVSAAFCILSMAATMEASPDFPLSVSFRSASDSARLLPGLSDDIALMCLAMVPRGYWGVLKCVSKAWRGTFSSEDICSLRRLIKRTESWLYVLTHGAGPTLQAYSPVLDRWFKFPWKANLAPGSMVGVGEHLVVVGGRASDSINPNTGEPEHPDFTSQVRLFNARTLAWFDGPPIPQAFPCLCSWSDGSRAFIGALTRGSFHVLSSEVPFEDVHGVEAPVDATCGVLPSNKDSSCTANLRGTVLRNWRTFAQGPVDVRDGEGRQVYNVASAQLTPFTMNGKQQVAIYNDSTSPSVIFEVDPENGTQEARGWVPGPPLPYGGGTVMAIAVLSI
ncbi:unnamed protein product [Closterium sp. Yama58-4]|nr:unnamed protein product [Closterium sp. Yama58-4]